ncbi:MAG TPA: sialidase family protein [Flavisolibacter sp.]|nr:sialidase family protein [Flavisolibacter sp.]
MKASLLFLFAITLGLTACKNSDKNNPTTEIIGEGGVPDVAKDDKAIHITYGKGDSILYSFSSDNGNSFSKPEVVDTVAKLFSFAMRGPQITSTADGICIIAATQQGDLLSYQKDVSGRWTKTGRVNDVDTIAKEGLLALDGDGNNLFAVWLDLRQDNLNNIYGAKSVDGGKTWAANKMIYSSPDGHVCECCKPSVAVQGNQVNVMFRNWLDSNRNLYLIQSFDGGNTFNGAQKLGTGNWKLAGCPMDGGGVAVNKSSVVQTVWRREGKIYTAEPGKQEIELGEGKSCTIEMVNGKNVYAWVEKGEVIVVKPGGIKMNVGKGSLPALKAINNEEVLCVWQKDKEIHQSVIEL